MKDLPPGRELDALIAEKVMGWTNICGEQSWMAGIHPESKLPLDLPYYSTDISAAWEVVEKLKITRHVFIASADDDAGWVCETIYGGPNVLVKASTAPHAICLASLEAVGYKYPSTVL